MVRNQYKAQTTNHTTRDRYGGRVVIGIHAVIALATNGMSFIRVTAHSSLFRHTDIISTNYGKLCPVNAGIMDVYVRMS